MVLFNSIDFIFRFIPVFLVLFYVTPARYRDWTLMAGSAVFYVVGTGMLSLVLFALIPVNWLMGRVVFRDRGLENSRFHKGIFVTAVVLDAGVLIACKLLGFFVDGSLMPLGISFFIFKMISYQADLLQGKMEEMPSLLQTALYFTAFVQVTQGPIMRYDQGNFANTRKIPLKSVADGLFFFILGLSMKVLVADRLAILWNDLIRIGYESLSTQLAWVGAYTYSLRLYMDFWGYSLMAAGLGMMVGFKFVINFLHPYAASGITDFYRRWHASLGSWFRDYVYVPLGGSRAGTGRTIRNLLIVWAITGLWHGLTPNFFIWAMSLSLFIIWEKFVIRRMEGAGGAARFLAALLERLHVLVLIPITWVVFAIPQSWDLLLYLQRMFPFFTAGINVNPQDYMKYLELYWPYLLSGAVLCLPLTYRILVRYRRTVPVVFITVALFWLSVYQIVTAQSNPFMYFSF